ncbi:MAG: NAD(P)(+) transhydrogenase (Re/Si-specific) subunit alpha, partial [Acidimicrobiia bacterium]
VTRADVVVTTAAIPGQPAPRLVSSEMVASMRPGAVIVDGAASTGGNCELTEPDEIMTHGGVVVSGPLDLPSRAPNHASLLYGRNVTAFIGFLTGDDGSFDLDPDDEVIAETLAAREGEIVNSRVPAALADKE